MAIAQLSLRCPSVGDLKKLDKDFFEHLDRFVREHGIAGIVTELREGSFYVAIYPHSTRLPYRYYSSRGGFCGRLSITFQQRSRKAQIETVGRDPSSNVHYVYRDYWKEHAYLPVNPQDFETDWQKACEIVLKFLQTTANKIPPQDPSLFTRLGKAISCLQ